MRLDLPERVAVIGRYAMVRQRVWHGSSKLVLPVPARDSTGKMPVPQPVSVSTIIGRMHKRFHTVECRGPR